MDGHPSSYARTHMRGIWQQAIEMGESEIERVTADTQRLYRREMEDFLREQALALPARRSNLWHWDYSSLEAYRASIAPNVERWRLAVGEFGSPDAPLEANLLSAFENAGATAQWLVLPFFGHLKARAILALPKLVTAPHPLVVLQHGMSGGPEKVFGLGDPTNAYHSCGMALLEAGFAVLAPINVVDAHPRARLERLCLMLGGTVFGLEIQQTAKLLDYVGTRRDLDANRTAMWGISMGGAYVMFTLPLEPRLRAGITTAWFNKRVPKMVVDDPRYSCFLSADAEHVFIPGWLREFGDSDLASLICPRPLQVQTGKCDAIAWWPWVVEEFEEAAEHYRKLGVGERIELDLHEGGHEMDVEAGIRFLRRWLIDETW